MYEIFIAFCLGLNDFTPPMETNVSFTNLARGPERRRKRITVMTIQSTILNTTIETDGSLEFSETFNVSVDPSILDFYPNMTLPSTSTFTITDLDGKLDCSRSMCVFGAPNSFSYTWLEYCTLKFSILIFWSNVHHYLLALIKAVITVTSNKGHYERGRTTQQRTIYCSTFVLYNSVQNPTFLYEGQKAGS